MTIKSSFAACFTSLIFWVRLAACFAFLAACQATIEKTPDSVTVAFWQAVIKGDIQVAQNYVSKDSHSALSADQARKFSAVQVGAMTLDGDSATVVTHLSQNDKQISFNTALLKESNVWKVDYQQTRMNISLVPFQGIVNELQNIGENFGEQLQQQVPLIEKGLQNFGNKLNRQLENFNHELEKSTTNPNKTKRDNL